MRTRRFHAGSRKQNARKVHPVGEREKKAIDLRLTFVHNASSYQARAPMLYVALPRENGCRFISFLISFIYNTHIAVGCERAPQEDRGTKCIRRISLKKDHRLDTNVCNKIFMCHSHLHISLAAFFCKLKFIPVLRHVCTHWRACTACTASQCRECTIYAFEQKFVHKCGNRRKFSRWIAIAHIKFYSSELNFMDKYWSHPLNSCQMVFSMYAITMWL